ncbi:hypothetical protein RERY_02620 [Rhodococcus erythropolis]|nr:hypothetical protein RERY_02620 [Rhodococcus erythropolis]
MMLPNHSPLLVAEQFGMRWPPARIDIELIADHCRPPRT